VPLVQVLGGLERTDNTASIRLSPDDNGNERLIEVGGAPMEVTDQELRNIASNYEVAILEDAPVSTAAPAGAPSAPSGSSEPSGPAVSTSSPLTLSSTPSTPEPEG
jgi:hypothetical protein